MNNLFIKIEPQTVEIWRDIKGYEKIYKISNLGNVKSFYFKKNGKLLKPETNGKGYMQVILYKNKKRKKFYIHKLVAQAFIPNTYNKLCIDHIDTNKKNNLWTNLRWVTYKEQFLNTITIQNNLGKNGRPVNQYNENGKFIKKWKSTCEVAKYYNVNVNNITACCRKNYNEKCRKHKSMDYIFCWTNR